MKKMITMMARYNQLADINLLKTLEGVEYDKLKHNVGTYFNNPLEVISHYVATHIMFINAFKTQATCNICCAEVREFAVDGRLKDEVLKDFKSLKNCIEKVDAKLLEIIENIDDFGRIARLEFPKVTFEKSLGQFMLTAITHAIHHRGELSAMLEILGIENDFAGMLGMDF